MELICPGEWAYLWFSGKSALDTIVGSTIHGSIAKGRVSEECLIGISGVV